ncbi:MAG TPA: ATP-binding protein [Nitrospirae bacterium]|nr:serine-protein kinase RsbW [bacterium BMS3Abin10]GBE38273.1 serine-protein kinase RsbW [bacterium BMS3Bbin08]HDH50889.1 ATP-binding protein [Nitrospirota bacterium]HDK16612.1 ATP-binding protein [Nitrospirota bacterium]HDK41543.1 ATP-binding protein [Nitrospirota bacterium]
MKDSIAITIPAHPRYLCVVRDVTVSMGKIYNLPETDIENIKLAVDEACSNVIKYACRGDTTQKIDIKFSVTKKGFEVVIDDNGIKAKPELIEGRSLTDIRPGGLGVHLIKRAFDVVSFDETKKKGNRLRLIRRLDKKAGVQ